MALARPSPQTAASLFVLTAICGWPIFGSLVGIASSGDTPTPALLFRVAVVCLGLMAYVIYRLGGVDAKTIKAIYLAFWCYYIGKLLVEVWIPENNAPLSGETYLGYAFLFGALPSLLVFIRLDMPTVRSLAGWITVLSLLGIVLTLLDIALATFRGHPYFYAAMLRLGSEKMNPIALGHLCTTFILCSACLISRAGVALRVKVLLVVICAATVPVLTLTASKGPMVALVVGLLVFSISTFGWSKFAVSSLFIILISAFVIGLSAATVDLSNSIFSPIVNRFSGLSTGSDDQSTAGRIIAYRGAIEQFFEHPLLGDVPFEKVTFNYPHNIFLEVFMSMGTIGALIFAPTVCFAAKAIRHCLANGTARWAGLLAIQYFVAALFSGAIYTNALTWFTAALAIAVWQSTRVVNMPFNQATSC